MTKFVEVRAMYGDDVIINLDKIILVRPYHDETDNSKRFIIIFDNDDAIHIDKDNYDILDGYMHRTYDYSPVARVLRDIYELLRARLR